MNVSILFSGGKDSAYVIDYCNKQGWDIETLIAVKPKSSESYLWHYATVEWTPLIAKSIGIPLVLLDCDAIGPDIEAAVLEKILPNLSSDVLVIGGVGLQKTQIREIKNIAEKYGKQVVVPHDTYTSEQLLREELEKGLEIVITETAAEGLGKEWIGKKITKENFDELKKASEKFGFDMLGEGGSYNTFVTDAPFFKKKIFFADSEVVWDEKLRTGYLLVKNAAMINKAIKGIY